MIMKLVTQNRVIIAILVTIIFSILFLRSNILNQTQEGLEEQMKLRLYVINMEKDKTRYQKLMKHYKHDKILNNYFFDTDEVGHIENQCSECLQYINNTYELIKCETVNTIMSIDDNILNKGV